MICNFYPPPDATGSGAGRRRTGSGDQFSVFLGRPVKIDLPVGDPDDALRLEGDRVIVRDHDDRAAFPVQFLKESQHFTAGPRVQRAGRLVGEDQRGVACERAGDR